MTVKKHQIDGKFYPLQREELLTLRKLRIVNNRAFVYLALKYENPYCNRPIEIQMAEFCLRWGIPESSLYKAIAELNDHGAIKIHTRTIIVDWAKNAESVENSLSHSQQASASNNGEFILDFDNEFSKSRKDIYIDRARVLESLENLEPPLPPQGEVGGGGRNFFNTGVESNPRLRIFVARSN